MPAFIIWICLFVCLKSPADEIAKEIILGVGSNQVLRLPSVTRVAIGNSKIAKVKAISSTDLLLTGVKAGKTSLQVWQASRVLSYELTVLDAQSYDQFSTMQENKVVQVALEFLELDSALSRSIGLKWPDAIQFSGQAVMHGVASTTGLNYTSTFASTKGLLEFLERDGFAKLLANPDLYVRLGEEAVFHSGGEFPVASNRSSFGENLKHVQWKPFGLSVKVLPRSGDGLYFNSDIEVEISEVNRALSADGIPALTKRKLTTKTSSKDGETVVLSGLVRSHQATESEGMPFFKKIPLVGYLFQREGSTKQETELVMAVTVSLYNGAKEKTRIEAIRNRLGNFQENE